MLMQRLNDLGEDTLGDLSANLDRVISISEDLGLNDGSETVFLADGCVPGKGVCSLED